MKSFIYFLSVPIFILIINSANAQQGVAINVTGAQADNSAMLDINSTEKGLLIPRMTTTQRTSISSPAQGLLVYDTDYNQFWFYDGSVWVEAIGPQGPAGPAGSDGATGPTGPTGPLVSGSSGQTLRHDGSSWIANSILFNNGTNVGIGTTNPSQKLHIDDNVRFDGSLMPGGSAGSSGQILTSQGSGMPPAWQTPSSLPVYGNNAQSIQLTALATNNDVTGWSSIPGMSITFTPQHSVFYVFASLCARLADNSGNAQFGQALIQVRLLVNGTEEAKAATILTDFDEDMWGGYHILTSGTVAFSGVRVNVVSGQSTTVSLQWRPVVLWADSPWRIEINPSNANVADHCVLTVFD